MSATCTHSNSCAACIALVMYRQKYSMIARMTFATVGSLQVQPALPNRCQLLLTGDCLSDQANLTAVTGVLQRRSSAV